MPYKITKTRTVSVDAPKFDEWFDSLPIDYFANHPHSDGKNKFELLESLLDPAAMEEVVPENAIIVEIPTPVSTTESDESTETEIRHVVTEIWESKIAYRTSKYLRFVFFTNNEDLNNLLNSLESVDWDKFELSPDKKVFDADGAMTLNLTEEDKQLIKDSTGWTYIPPSGKIYTIYPNMPHCSVFDIYESTYVNTTITEEEI